MFPVDELLTRALLIEASAVPHDGVPCQHAPHALHVRNTAP
ncbi:hypothetical protein [Streptomyces avermitilis]